jgi:type IV pilus assembly protein PilQ
VDIDSDLERTLDTTKYRGPIKAISAYRVPSDPSTVRVVVELDKKTKHNLERVGTTYYWDFDKPVRTAQASPKKKSKKKAKKSKKSKKKKAKKKKSTDDDATAEVVGGYGASSTPITQKSVAQLKGSKRKVYRGTKIDLDFKDADIHNLLRLLADVGGVNIVIPDEIRARVTVRLRRVPWDQALEVILASKGLWYRRDGNLYRVAPRKQLDAEDQAEAERIRALVQSEAPEPEIFTLNYAVAKDIKAQLAPLLSPKGRIEVDVRTNALIINDIKAHRRRIIDLVRRLDTQTPQIQIEARIVEARSTFVREIGVQWGGNASATAAGGNATGLIFPNNAALAGGAEDNQTNNAGVANVPSDFAVNLPAAVGTGSGGAIGVSLGSVGGNFNLNLRLSALEDSGSVRIISAPKITVVNNVTAEISQGVSIPISVISANGVQTQFVPADLALKVTPHVAERDCSIAMELEVKKNEADFVNTGARGDPTILRKEAKTTILVADGETTVIGGIYTRNTGLAYSKVPFFGDLPVIGWFFKSRRENDERTEVLVFITPKITNKAYLRCE